MSKRVCNVTGCPTLIDVGQGRCPKHQRQAERARGTRQQRGYDVNHDRLRATYQARIDAGQSVTCWRCGKPLTGRNWHLGHDDNDRNLYRGPECVPCNTATAGRMSR